MSTHRTTPTDRHRPAVLRQVPAADGEEELRAVEVSREAGAGRAVPRGGVGRPAVHGARRLARG